MGTAVHQITLEEFLARPEREDDQREELIERELILSPGAKVGHAYIVRRLSLGLAALEHQGYLLMNDFSCILGGHSMPTPDLAAVTQDRCDQAMKNDNWLIGSPELVVEVSSPSNRKLNRKADVYLKHGAEQVWIVYPKTKTVTVITLNGTTEVHIGESLNFQGVEVQVSSIFPDV